MSTKTLKRYVITDPKRGIMATAWTRADARGYRLPFKEKIVQMEYKVAPDGTIEIINQKQVR